MYNSKKKSISMNMKEILFIDRRIILLSLTKRTACLSSTILVSSQDFQTKAKAFRTYQYGNWSFLNSHH